MAQFGRVPDISALTAPDESTIAGKRDTGEQIR